MRYFKKHHRNWRFNEDGSDGKIALYDFAWEDSVCSLAEILEDPDIVEVDEYGDPVAPRQDDRDEYKPWKEQQ